MFAQTIIPRSCKCGLNTQKCRHCQVFTEHCLGHSKHSFCETCYQIYRCHDGPKYSGSRCLNLSIQCYVCHGLAEGCISHNGTHRMCTRCYDVMRCPHERKCGKGGMVVCSSVRTKCLGCQHVLPYCDVHDTGSNLCDRCLPYKCRVDRCRGLMTPCRQCVLDIRERRN